MSIAHNQIQNEIPHHTQIHHETPGEEILKKKCCECGEIKDIREFNLTITGKRHQAQCKNCETLLFIPKKIPKITGMGKPLFKEFSHEETRYKLNKGKCKTCNNETNPKQLRHGLCPRCWEIKKKLALEERLKGLRGKIIKLTTTTGKDWFTAKTLANYQQMSYEWAYTNLVRMEELKMVKSRYEDRRKYWKVINDE